MPVRVERTMATPAQDIWSAISCPGALELCRPFCAGNPVQVWPGLGARDEVHYLNGVVYERRFLEWTDRVGYDLEIGRAGGRKSLMSWRIATLDDATCRLRITVCPHVLQPLAVAVRWVPHALWLRPRLRADLDAVAKGFDWYVTRGEPVPRNAFGIHVWLPARESV
jgi:hypothetical protein